MPEPVRGGQRYLAGLDGLRALAVFAVVAYHLGLGWAQGGLLGVGVFFTLSGYLITDILLGHWQKSGSLGLRDFWLRRARRLLPALFVMLVVVAVWGSVAEPAQVPELRGDVVASVLYVSNWWFIAQHASYFAQFGPPSPLSHLWSLAVEEQFYLLWPWLLLLGLLLLGRRSRRPAPAPGGPAPGGPAPGGPAPGGPAPGGPAGPGSERIPGRYALTAITLAAAAASAVAMARFYHPGYDPTRAYEGTDTRACGLLIGAALAMLWPTRRASWKAPPAAKPVPPATTPEGPPPLPADVRPVVKTSRWPKPSAASRALDAAGLLGLAIIVVMVWGTTEYSPFMFSGGMVLLSLATALVVAAVVHPATRLGRALGCGPLRWLGVRSYGIYLWHYPVIVLISPPLGGISAIRAVAASAGSVGIAAVSWTFVEEPIRRRRRPRLKPRGLRPTLRRRLIIPALAVTVVVALFVGIVVALRSTPGHSQTAAYTAHRPRSTTAAPHSASHIRPTSKSAPRNAKHKEHGTAVAAGKLETSCRSVVHIGDSTSEGLISSDYLPNPAQRITARYAQVGVTSEHMEIQGATSVVETINDQPNAYDVAKGLVDSGYHGCWVIALGTNDTADVFVGSPVGRMQRIERMMSVIGNQPVLWINVKSLVESGPYSEQDMQLWNQALTQAERRYPNMRVYNWAAVVQDSWFISDGIHYTSHGYAERARLIAGALARAFPANS
jgi:peptidoglycan/LPS O-acetylase OafA/YrhL